MNQQRSRRFRTVNEAKELKEKADRNGEKLPDDKAFDSNCITLGEYLSSPLLRPSFELTLSRDPIHGRLSELMPYFINKKISEDSNWWEIEVVFLGHKILEYIQLSRAQPDYNSNIQHYLYGLDAGLIMLGLFSHDSHFCLLREEVKFGPALKKGGNARYVLHVFGA